MRAFTSDRFGGNDVLRLTDVPDPIVGGRRPCPGREGHGPGKVARALRGALYFSIGALTRLPHSVHEPS